MLRNINIKLYLVTRSTVDHRKGSNTNLCPYLRLSKSHIIRHFGKEALFHATAVSFNTDKHLILR